MLSPRRSVRSAEPGDSVVVTAHCAAGLWRGLGGVIRCCGESGANRRRSCHEDSCAGSRLQPAARSVSSAQAGTCLCDVALCAVGESEDDNAVMEPVCQRVSEVTEKCQCLRRQ
jgi:hypothetical protein